MRAEIRLAYSPPDVSTAEDSLLQAIYWAGKQSATAWELKAAVPLARMWQQQGQADRARDLLGRLLQRFGEGVQTEDLNAASALLAELNSADSRG